MLTKLEIQNYAIIDHLEILFPAGLTIITGETGAGKSILLGALGLIMGNRADSKVLYNQDVKCFVEATFEISDYELKPFFDDEGLDYHNELIIRREIAPNGKSRAFVNDSPVTLDILHTLSAGLIDLHQQFDTLDIQRQAFQLQILDALANNKSALEAYTVKYKTYRQSKTKLEELRTMNRNAMQEVEYLNFQLNEFDEAGLHEGEDVELEAALAQMTATEDIKKMHAMLMDGLSDSENALINALQMMINQYGVIRHFDTVYQDLYDRLQSVREELTDVAKESAHIYESTEYNEELIQHHTNRLNVINKLKKKHGVIQMADLLKIEQEIRSQLDNYADLSSTISDLEQELVILDKELRDQAAAIRKARLSVISEFEAKVHTLLAGLSMENAYIRVDVRLMADPGPSGMDDVDILFAPNKGSAFLPLKDTASGGELSRLTLCIKSLVAGSLALPTLIFDEIDAGVSGEVAHQMGNILVKLSDNHQVICITHSPQISAKAQRHFWVYKSDTAERTVTAMKALTDEERVIEIAKMLSGNPPSELAIANARELVGL
ncbi:MAG: DNA repair protein RecN [Saprospiraceae bacterium]|nr:MAG: DNA repair protein RecN [Bacteroidetes bacterium OLB9]MCO6462850.1 DNA repair protein RecN [Saprospiraceae bacterium]MCZ2338678.1 DNA repair protein RecN [Chitinophagales bacterium]